MNQPAWADQSILGLTSVFRETLVNDTWRLNSRLNLNYGLGWSIDRNLNYDLTKPALLAPILGADGLGPTGKQWKDFSPVLGLAWSPRRDGKTVFRTGAGIFYDFLFSPILDIERALLGPPGSGRQNFPEPRSPIACLAFPAFRLEGLSTFLTTRQRGLRRELLGMSSADSGRASPERGQFGSVYSGDPIVQAVQRLESC